MPCVKRDSTFVHCLWRSAWHLTSHSQKEVNMALIIGIIIGALLVIFLIFRLLGWIF
jgi:sensor c-di-GMP phosphodiesterase-like protein